MLKTKSGPSAGPIGPASRLQPAGSTVPVPFLLPTLTVLSSLRRPPLSNCFQAFAHTVPSSQNTLSSPSSFIPHAGPCASPPCAHASRVLPEHCSHLGASYYLLPDHSWGISSPPDPGRGRVCPVLLVPEEGAPLDRERSLRWCSPLRGWWPALRGGRGVVLCQDFKGCRAAVCLPQLQLHD